MTGPEQLPPTYDLPADAQRRMREHLLAEITGAEATSRSRHHTWLVPAAVAASVLLAAGGFTVIRALTGSPAPDGATGPDTNSSTASAIDCGTFNLGLDKELPESAPRCMADAAAAGTPARLQQTRLTDEGDPIVETYTVDGRERIHLVIDTRADKYGPQTVRLLSCTQLTQRGLRLVAGNCTESTLGSN
ncbi:DUF4362 domain-containing protein [Actinoplanes regularis]|uniref:DUF4362 domain-containing protein n=1 Tax=Actinoplanes regularis TaxID=52697 RepID=UPI0024A4B134|nr:DUF4362 domain-containing protein [Actinoplanes regularis]GLW35837.1 hypothetical protein Areg01_87720 [Actinoplanes regularis]